MPTRCTFGLAEASAVRLPLGGEQLLSGVSIARRVGIPYTCERLSLQMRINCLFMQAISVFSPIIVAPVDEPDTVRRAGVLRALFSARHDAPNVTCDLALRRDRLHNFKVYLISTNGTDEACLIWHGASRIYRRRDADCWQRRGWFGAAG